MSANFGEMNIDELVNEFQEEYEIYWRLVISMSLKESRGTKDRRDLEQLAVCYKITDEIKSRPPGDVLKLKRFLNDERPEIRLESARAIEEFDLDAAVSAFRELAKRNLGANGRADPYGVQSRLALSRLKAEGKIS